MPLWRSEKAPGGAGTSHHMQHQPGGSGCHACRQRRCRRRRNQRRTIVTTCRPAHRAIWRYGQAASRATGATVYDRSNPRGESRVASAPHRTGSLFQAPRSAVAGRLEVVRTAHRFVVRLAPRLQLGLTLCWFHRSSFVVTGCARRVGLGTPRSRSHRCTGRR